MTVPSLFASRQEQSLLFIHPQDFLNHAEAAKLQQLFCPTGLYKQNE